MYSLYMLEDRLVEHLNLVDDEAQERMDILVRQMMEKQGITEELKAHDQMEWVRAVNNIRNAKRRDCVERISVYLAWKAPSGSFLLFLQTIFSCAGRQSIYMEQMQREKILEGYDS